MDLVEDAELDVFARELELDAIDPETATLAALIRRNCRLLALRPAVRRRRGSRAPPILATVVKASSH